MRALDHDRAGDQLKHSQGESRQPLENEGDGNRVLLILAYEYLPVWLSDAPQWSSLCALSFFDWRRHPMQSETRAL